MLKIENPSKPNIMTFEPTGQKFSIYVNNNSNTFTAWFHVNDYYSHNGRKLSQRSYKTFKRREDAITWATRICELLPKKDVGKNKKIEEIVKSGKTFNHKEFQRLVAETLLMFESSQFITSYNVMEAMGLVTENKTWNDAIYRACSSIRLHNKKYGVKTVDCGKPSKDFSLGGKGKRPSQIFRVLGQI